MLTGKRYASDNRGSVAVEFALVSLTAVMLILFILCGGLILYLNQALDQATTQASRNVMTGAAQTAAISSSDFRAQVCAGLPRTMTCANLIINLYTVNKEAGPGGFYRFVNADRSGLSLPDLSQGAGQFNLGVRGDYQYLQVIYPITFAPTPILKWLSGGATFNGAPAYLAISTAAFRNEQF